MMCFMCGCEPCTNPVFCRLSRKLEGVARKSKLRPDPPLERLQRLVRSDKTLDAVWAELNHPRNFRTPQMTVEAILVCVSERGLDALKEPANVERLARCDSQAKTELQRRIDKLRAQGRLPC